uniref:Secreted protein n=1 Tax=Steinernema glaseri TaxID=37863 RepID=A0A1I8AJS3_9BILA
MQVLAKYNIMGLGLGLGVAAMAQMRSSDTSHQVSAPQPQRYDMNMSANSSMMNSGIDRYDSSRSSFNDTHLSGSAFEWIWWCPHRRYEPEEKLQYKQHQRIELRFISDQGEDRRGRTHRHRSAR